MEELPEDVRPPNLNSRIMGKPIEKELSIEIQMFIKEWCKLAEPFSDERMGPNGIHEAHTSMVLYQAFQRWCKQNGKIFGNRRYFTMRMESKFYHKKTYQGTNFYGIDLRKELTLFGYKDGGRRLKMGLVLND